MSLLGKPIEEVITSLYESIKSKRSVITNIKNDYNIENTSDNSISIPKLKLIDLLDEFDITISQSLQCIQTLQAEICNLKENQQEQSFNKALSIQSPSIIQNDESINYQFDSIVPNNNNNMSVITSLANNNTQQQIYHKPKGVAATIQKQNKLNFDYSNIVLPSNMTTINNNISATSLSTITIPHNENKKTNKQMPNLLISYDTNKKDTIKDDNDSEKEPEVEKIKIPIRQNLHNISHTSNNTIEIENNNVSIGSRREVLMAKVNQIEKEKRIKKLLNKICSVTSYKTYIADKYGNGDYRVFSNKIKNNELDIDALERELKIISDLVENDLHIRNRTITNNSYRSNTPKRKNSLSKGKISNKEDNVNAYIEPVNFANILRGNNERKKSTSKSKRMNSKEKKKDTLI